MSSATKKPNKVCHRKQRIKAYINGDTDNINPNLGEVWVVIALL